MGAAKVRRPYSAMHNASGQDRFLPGLGADQFDLEALRAEHAQERAVHLAEAEAGDGAVLGHRLLALDDHPRAGAFVGSEPDGQRVAGEFLAVERERAGERDAGGQHGEAAFLAGVDADDDHERFFFLDS